MYDRGHRRARSRSPAPGAFVAFLDTTIVNIAFPDISASFPEASRGLLSWVLDGYFVVIAALLVPAGGLADRFGHRRIFLLGVAGFTVASALCAAAPTLELLIAFRVLQGVAAAMIAPASLAIVLDSFPREHRAAGVGLWGAAAAAAAAVGPTLGGALVELSDWRLVFLVNLPLGAAIVLAGRARLPRPRVLDSRLPGSARGADAGARPGGADPGNRRGQRLGLDLAGDARLLRRRRGAARGGRLPQPHPPAPDRRAGALRPPLLRASATSAPCSSPPPSSR